MRKDQKKRSGKILSKDSTTDILLNFKRETANSKDIATWARWVVLLETAAPVEQPPIQHKADIHWNHHNHHPALALHFQMVLVLVLVLAAFVAAELCCIWFADEVCQNEWLVSLVVCTLEHVA